MMEAMKMIIKVRKLSYKELEQSYKNALNTIEQLNNIIKSLFDYCKEQQEKSFDSVAEECYAEVMYFISERLERTKN